MIFALPMPPISSPAPSVAAESAARAKPRPGTAILPTASLAKRAFGNDAPWFEANIPFFACSDPKIEAIYYYRWNLYKAHLRDVGDRGTVVTEFLDDVGWQRWPWASLNDATPFHIREGRWLRDRRYVDGYIDFLYEGGGNDRHFSEGIAAATFDAYEANGDAAFATKHLSAMRHIYNLWEDRYDASKGLYWIEPLLDATEYTISSIDASGGKDGFRGGDAFRPTINAYMYGNARAISRLAAMGGDAAGARDYAARAERLKATVQSALWNPALGHFTDRYQVTNANVRYWEFVRGRELEGYVPWAYGLPDDTPEFNAAWRYLTDPKEFAGAYGLRTVGPSYEHYMRQYRYEGTRPECQWNGPSWPFQTTQVLTGLANLLNASRQSVIGTGDYLRLLRQYTDQHFLDGALDLQEDYNPDTGRPIVGLDRSHHYNHSGYTDLIVTGLAGLRPRADDTLEVRPLIPTSGATIGSFVLENVPYHGHAVTILWDADGTRYRRGTGLSVYVDGRRRIGPSPLGRVTCPLGKPRVTRSTPIVNTLMVNTAVNVARRGFPAPSASSGAVETLWPAIDGRTWFFPEVPRGWTAPPSADGTSWFALDYGAATTVGEVRLAFGEDEKTAPPSAMMVETWDGRDWRPVASVSAVPTAPIGSGANVLTFAPVSTARLRVVFRHDRPLRLVEIETRAKEGGG